MTIKELFLIAEKILFSIAIIFTSSGCTNTDLQVWQRYGYKPAENIEKFTSYEHKKIYRTKIGTILARSTTSAYNSWRMFDWPNMPNEKGNAYRELSIGTLTRLEGVYTNYSQTVGPTFIIVFEVIDQNRNPVDVPWSKFILEGGGNPSWRKVSPETGEVSDDVFEEVAE